MIKLKIYPLGDINLENELLDFAKRKLLKPTDIRSGFRRGG